MYTISYLASKALPLKRVLRSGLFIILFLTNSCSLNHQPSFSISVQQSDKNNTLKEIILFCGNPGVGKSSLCNSIFQKGVFNSGVSGAIGMTRTQQWHECDGQLYVDTPGLDDTSLKEAAAAEIEKALKKEGNYKIIFVAMLDAGRIRSADLITINTVCEAIQTPFEYGIIFNKVTANARKKVDETGGIEKYLMQLSKKPSLCTFISFDNDMHDQDDTFLKEEAENRQNLIDFIARLNPNVILAKDINELDVRDLQQKIIELEEKYKKEIAKYQDEIKALKEDIQGVSQSMNTILIHEAKADKKENKISILHTAAEQNDIQLLKLLGDKKDRALILNNLNTKDFYGYTPLHLAVKKNNLEAVQLLLKNNAIDVNVKDENGKTPLHYAVSAGNLDIVAPLLDEYAPCKTDVNIQDKNLKTALHVAVEKGDIGIIQLLFIYPKSKVDVNLKDNKGQTSLHLAVEKEDIDAINTLLFQPEIKVNQGDNARKTPLHYAVSKGNEAIVTQLLSKNADVDAKNDKKRTPLHDTVAEGNETITKILLENSQHIGINNQCKNDKTAMHLAAKKGHTKIIDLLLNKGANINQKDGDGNTPLHYAAKGNHKKTVKLLLRKRANVNIRNRNLTKPSGLCTDPELKREILKDESFFG